MQFQIPQFIDTEDKIINGPFPLTLRQFIYICVGGLITAMFYFVVQTWLAIVIGIICIGGAIAISFVKVEGRTLGKVIVSAANFYWHPQIYVWQLPHEKISKATPPPKKEDSGIMASLEKVAEGAALHKHWESLQTGEKMSANEFTEKKMNERYGIFRGFAGDPQAARRVDYR